MTAHAVCRVCGRILRVPVLPNEEEFLRWVADHRPSGWSADTITFSVAGACPDCRAGRRP